MRRGWWRYALQQRLGTLAAAALILWTAATTVAASIATGRITDALVDERETRARAIASRIELALRDDMRQLDLVAAASNRSADDAALAAAVRRVRLAESVIRLDRTGRALWARSVANGGKTTPVVERLPDAGGNRWHVEGSALLPTAAGPRAFLILPARETDPAGGAVAAAIAPGTSGLRTLLESYAEEPYLVALTDRSGGEIAASRAAERGSGRNPTVAGAPGDLLVADAPLPDGQWLVRLSQPRAEALGPVLTLRRILVGSSALLVPFAVLVAVGAARSIRRPIVAMIATAERLARGEVADPIPPAGEDEIGRLAAALEQLRRTLESDERRAILLKHVISAQEEERRRIARELHDQTTQQLTALAMQLDGISASHPDAAPALERAHGIARAAIDDLHRVIYDLRPSMLDDLGLLPAIHSYAQTHLEPRGIQVHCELPDSLPEISRDATTALYRVAQEALTNVMRHARADTVLIACTVAHDRIVLEVEDDGTGFEPATVGRPRPSGEGLGLLGMRERLSLLGGRLEIESEPGQGTRVVAVLPLDGRHKGSPA
jgi:signal transduction histidine kinase